MYADDMTLIAPSAKGRKSLLHTCENLAIKHEIIFNSIYVYVCHSKMP